MNRARPSRPWHRLDRVTLVVLCLPVPLLLALLLAPAAASQEAATPGEVEILEAEADEDGLVSLTVSSPDEQMGADFASAFRVTENGEPVDATVSAVSGAPLRVVLVIDTSGSMDGGPLEQARQAALTFLDAVGPDVPVGVVTAGSPTTVVAPPDSDRAATTAAVNSLVAEGETALFDSLIVASSALGAEAAEGRNAIVLLTDGADTSSLADTGLATQAIDAVDAELTAIALESPDQDLDALRALVESVDGGVEVAPDEDDLGAIFEGAAIRLANRWTITFNTASSFERARVDVTLVVDGVELTDGSNIEIPSNALVAEPPDEELTFPVPETYRREAPSGFTASAAAPWAAALAVVIAVALVVWAVAPRPSSERRLAVEEGIVTQRDGIAGWRARLESLGAAAVDRAGYTGRLDRLLDQAGLDITPGDLVMVAGGSVLGATLVGAAWSGPLGAIFGAVAAVAAVAGVLARTRQVRRRRFADQLADSLGLLAGSLRAGNGIGGAIDAISEEVPSPMSDELARATLEARLGRSLPEALKGIADRMESEDFTWIVEAIEVQRDVGGNLASVLDRVAATIRARQRLRRQIQAVTAEGRISAIVLMSLPVGITVILANTNPEYMDPLFTENRGRVILGTAVLLLLMGGAWLKKLVEPDL